MITFKQMTTAQRVGFIISILFIIGLTVGSFIWLTQKSYMVLFSDLEPRDASKLVEQLEKMKADFKLDASGTEVLVPESDVYKLRLKLMGSDFSLMGGVGFELFDNSDLGMTEFAQRINYQRAIEGELTRTIMSLTEVKYARVHIVMPEKGLFKDDDSPPSASVTLFLKKSSIGQKQHINEQQITGIQQLVSASVPHLEPSQVTVTDDQGVTLSQSNNDDISIGGLSNRLKQKQAFESYLNDKLNFILVKTFGPNVATATVDVDLNFNEVRKTRERVITNGEPKSGIAKKRETVIKSGTDQKSKEQKVTTDIDYDLGHEVEQIVEKPGKIKRLTVSLLIPDSLAESRVLQIENIVKNTVGLDESRGDVIAFYPTEAKKLIVEQKTVTRTPEIDYQQNTGDFKASTAIEKSGLSSESMNQSKMVLGVLVALLVLVTVYLISKLFKQKDNNTSDIESQLTEEERRQVLSTIQEWLTEPSREKQSEIS